MERLSEYITEYVSSGRGKKPSFPNPKELEDIKNIIEFLETMGFSDATQFADTNNMQDIISTFKRSNKPVYVFEEYYVDGEKCYWLRFFNTDKPTRKITDDNPIFTVSFNPSYNGSKPDTYYIERTVGDESITRITREEFMELIESHFGWI